MLSLMKKTAAKKASGRNVKEAERNTAALKVRISPKTAAWIREYADQAGCPQSYVVEIATLILKRALSGRDLLVSDLIEEVDSGDMFTDLYERDGK